MLAYACVVVVTASDFVNSADHVIMSATGAVSTYFVSSAENACCGFPVPVPSGLRITATTVPISGGSVTFGTAAAALSYTPPMVNLPVSSPPCTT